MEIKNPQEALEAWKDKKLDDKGLLQALTVFSMQIKHGLPQECFKYVEQVEKSDQADSIAIDQENPLNYDGEVSINVTGAEFTWPTYIDKDLKNGINITKSLFIEAIKLFITPLNIVGFMLSLLSTKRLSAIIHSYNRLGSRVLGRFILKDEHRTEFGLELQFFIFNFLIGIGIEEGQADKFAELIGFTIESDSAYPGRIKDLFSETTVQELYDKPFMEINRLINTNAVREIDKEHKKVSEKFKWIGRIVAYSLLLPKYRKAFKNAVNSMTIEKLQLTDRDLYWGTFKKDYDLMGLDFDERQSYAHKRGWKFPSLLV